jgi:hypothetical protein
VAPNEVGALCALRRLGVGVFELDSGQRLPAFTSATNRVALEALRQCVAELVKRELVPGLLLPACSLATERPLVLAVVALGRVGLALGERELVLRLLAPTGLVSALARVASGDRSFVDFFADSHADLPEECELAMAWEQRS